jgi:transcriptional regulator with XRE-family HTH domain
VRWEYRGGVTEIEPHEALAANLYRIAFAKRIPLEAVARSAGISLDELLAIATGEFDPDVDVITRIAQTLGVRVSELLAEPTFN